MDMKLLGTDYTGNAKIDARIEAPRTCGNCIISDRCPYFKILDVCHFSKIQAIALKNKNDVADAMSVILELQLERIYHMANVEKQSGGFINQELSLEIDRFFNSLKKMKDILSSDQFLRIEARGNILAELFTKK